MILTINTETGSIGIESQKPITSGDMERLIMLYDKAFSIIMIKNQPQKILFTNKPLPINA